MKSCVASGWQTWIKVNDRLLHKCTICGKLWICKPEWFARLVKRQQARKKPKILYRSGEPCKHLGCANHFSHPCEGCGRFLAMGNVYEGVLIISTPK